MTCQMIPARSNSVVTIIIDENDNVRFTLAMT